MRLRTMRTGPGLWAGIVLAVVMLAVQVASARAEAEAPAEQRLEAFLTATGFDVALDSIALSAENAPLMLGMRVEEFGFQWKQAAAEVFDSGRMRAMALDILSETLSDELLTHAVTFYTSPLGLRLVEVENASHMIKDDEDKHESGAALIAAMAQDDPERLALLERMNAAIDGDGSGLRAVQEIQLRFLLAAGQAGVIELTYDEAELRAVLKRNQKEMRESLEASALAGSAWTYRDFSNAEIEAYAEALEEPEMQEVYVLMNAIQWEIMANRFEVMAVKMAGMDRGEEL